MPKEKGKEVEQFFDKVLCRELEKNTPAIKAVEIAHAETARKFNRKNPLLDTSTKPI
jgi:hypothetical protein|tara:strand:+ start:310 stop:480 length:171 start_codon:yes stop_codon:yes gene_type:complete